jgi:uncharacterized RDD family membrane protein YckC
MSTHDALLLALPLTPTVGAAADRPAEPVGLGPRAAAFALDYLPIAGYLALLTAVGAGLGWAFPEWMARAFGQAARAQAIGFVLVTLPVGLYFALSEASRRQATWGKRRLGLVVVGPGGGRLGLGRSLARTATKFVPWELAHAAVWGIALAGGEPATVHLVLLALVWTLVGANVVGIGLGRRGLYDVLVGTRVVRGGVATRGASSS